MVGVGFAAHMEDTFTTVVEESKWEKVSRKRAVIHALDVKFKSAACLISRKELGKAPMYPVVPAQLIKMALSGGADGSSDDDGDDDVVDTKP